MRIFCEHGFFTFEEQRSGELSDFMRLFDGPTIVRAGNLFTFETLEDAPEYSIEGNAYLGATATATFAGRPAEVMRANGLIYDFSDDTVKPITSVTQSVELLTTSNVFLAAGLIIPGSVRTDGLRVTDYSAFYLFDSHKFKYSEVTFD